MNIHPSQLSARRARLLVKSPPLGKHVPAGRLPGPPLVLGAISTKIGPSFKKPPIIPLARCCPLAVLSIKTHELPPPWGPGHASPSIQKRVQTATLFAEQTRISARQ